MDWYATIKRYYDLSCYTPAQVQRFVTLGKITQEQADTIIGAESAA
ncbi:MULTISPECIES: XkdX family protein [unclassified Paenibacillus]|nr:MULTISPECIES: XkdX family protein [unclassified Paenibacillus]ASS66364.1 XkdX family protein [Paenibacillus sp. RUD330]SIQ06635.1 phage uncharacterized protein, XkdX family [Paenibacillus sp. RU4X]SIQ26743.1 phage uncharacterized protein, XkdX family [Paenibacillus sp. RU4T]